MPGAERGKDGFCLNAGSLFPKNFCWEQISILTFLWEVFEKILSLGQKFILNLRFICRTITDLFVSNIYNC